MEEQNRELAERAVRLQDLLEEAREMGQEAEGAERAGEAASATATATATASATGDEVARLRTEAADARGECEQLRELLLDKTQMLEETRDRDGDRIASLVREVADLGRQLREANEVAADALEGREEIEHQCAELAEERAGLAEGLEEVRSDLDLRKGECEVLDQERLGLVARLEDCEALLEEARQEREGLGAERDELREENGNLRKDLGTVSEECSSLKDRCDVLLEEKARLEKQVVRMEALSEGSAKSHAQLEGMLQRLSQENGAAREELTGCRQKLADATSRLNSTLSEKRQLQDALAASKKEWRDVCVQASSLVSPRATRTSTAQTSPTSIIISDADPAFPAFPSGQMTTAAPSADDVSSMKEILAEIQSALAASQASSEEGLLRALLNSEKELRSIRISLATAEEHIDQLKGQLFASAPKDATGADSADPAFEERMLRIKDAREKASLAATHQGKLAALASPDKKYSPHDEGWVRSDNKVLGRKESVRTSPMGKSVEADLTNMMSPLQARTPSVNSVGTYTTPAELRQKLSLWSPVPLPDAPGQQWSATASFAETEAFVQNILDSCSTK